MSEAYKTPPRANWFGEPVQVYSPTVRDVFGRVVAGTPVMTTGSVRLNQVEMMENGSRTLRAGATIKIPNSLGLDITPGATIVQAGGKSYTVIGVSGMADHRGIRHYLQLECVVKTDGDPQ